MRDGDPDDDRHDQRQHTQDDARDGQPGAAALTTGPGGADAAEDDAEYPQDDPDERDQPAEQQADQAADEAADTHAVARARGGRGGGTLFRGHAISSNSGRELRPTGSHGGQPSRDRRGESVRFTRRSESVARDVSEVLASAGAEVLLAGRGTAGEGTPAHFLQLRPRGHLLGEQRRLDPVEDTLEPA